MIDSFVNSSEKSLKKILEIIELRKNFIQSKLSVFKGDLRDKKFLEDVFCEITKDNKKIDGIIHFAGLKSVADSVANP